MTHDNDERLWLSAERSSMTSRYALDLIGTSVSERVGSIEQLVNGKWKWRVALTTNEGERLTDTGEEESASKASDAQFDALTRLEPARFMHKAA